VTTTRRGGGRDVDADIDVSFTSPRGPLVLLAPLEMEEAAVRSIMALLNRPFADIPSELYPAILKFDSLLSDRLPPVSVEMPSSASPALDEGIGPAFDGEMALTAPDSFLNSLLVDKVPTTPPPSPEGYDWSDSSATSRSDGMFHLSPPDTPSLRELLDGPYVPLSPSLSPRSVADAEASSSTSTSSSIPSILTSSFDERKMKWPTAASPIIRRRQQHGRHSSDESAAAGRLALRRRELPDDVMQK